MLALSKISIKLLGFLKAKTGVSLKILHNYGCFCMVVQCLRTMLDKLLITGWYGIMSTDIYNKPTDTHQYLSPQSCHPQHCTNSIPYSQALRIKRICSNEQTTKNDLGNWNIISKRGETTMRALTIVLTEQVVLTEQTSPNIKKGIRTMKCHLSSLNILCSVIYPPSFVNTRQQMRLIWRAWLYGILLVQCWGWQLCGERYWCVSVGLLYMSVDIIPFSQVM
jgi:hypothetical protein